MEKISEVWLLRIHSPAIGKNPAGWRDVAAFLTPQKAGDAVKALAENGRVTGDPTTATPENPNGNSWELKRLDVR